MESRYDFTEDGTTYIREQLLEETDGTWAAKDIADSGWSLYFRMYEVAGTLKLNAAMTKVQITAGDHIDGAGEKSGAAVYATPTFSSDRVTCRIVLVDTATPNANTVSGYREYVWLEWIDRVRKSPQP